MSDQQRRFVLRWGVVGLGAFSAKWINDVFSNYQRDAINGAAVTHELKAIVSSTSLSKAKKFLDLIDTSIAGTPKLYDSYDEFLHDDEIDIVYIAAPNSFHYPLAQAALQAGKHILVEKTFTINHEQAYELQKLAADRQLFVLHGVWTRFLPTTKYIEKLVLENGVIGQVTRVQADLSHDCPFVAENRLFNPELGGGVLFDNIIYSFTWVDLLLLSQSKSAPRINSWSILSKIVPNIDISSSITLVFDDLEATGTATGSFLQESPKYSVLIEGKRGSISIDRASRPTKAVITRADSSEDSIVELPLIDGLGYYYEANAAAVSIRDKLLEPAEYSFAQTIRTLEIFDQVKTKNGITYPTSIERI
ncbi:hypothetical protein OGAPHI_000882 [Ogataea philodendri]|uniref:D-xylose 1-dehydrogenase (NADP(+), D-xylono-1,5-lactone-forming) n=1 Tax=Ogataea philodendri TaxID=1378263 RepID=A0A9P8PE74_9ASCO|nr:uncharacterized protein OGAPHI_000882 [Ogataea philodendri]KAH3670367.1 hypothetical protein OGAPHI_000882 [Ogataea philodendri]